MGVIMKHRMQTISVHTEKGKTMDKIKVRPCKCGSINIRSEVQSTGVGWVCLIGCMDINCDAKVIRFGLTKNHAVRRAVKAWNRRVNNE